jgi:catechol 2,3-dioxygenase-like lactoylglutathione lyase family enzyme
MKLGRLDHVNVRTGDVERMAAWYVRVLGMERGQRPRFAFPGAWLYSEGHPSVHLVGMPAAPKGAEDPTLEHFAFAATGLAAFIAQLKESGDKYDLGVIPHLNIVQINVWDPDGNHIHIDFPAQESHAFLAAQGGGGETKLY